MSHFLRCQKIKSAIKLGCNPLCSPVLNIDCFSNFCVTFAQFPKIWFFFNFDMAVIQTIRDKYAKLAGGVIVLALVGFILMDATSGSSGGLFRKSTAVGEVNGDEIDYTEYDAAVNAREAEMKRQNPNGNFDEMQQAQLRDQVWTQIVNDKLLADINDKLGITVTKGELNDLLTGSNPDPSVKQAFTNPQTGVFNPQEVASTIAQLKKDPNRKADWDAFEADLIKRRYTNKFNALVAGSVYTPKFVLDDQHEARAGFANINYVKLPFTLIPDDKVSVTDDEIRKYMEERKAMFQVKESSRSVEYVAFDIVPSAQDSAKAFAEMENLKAEFAATSENETFVNRNSNNPVPANYFSRKQLESLPNVDELMSAPVNSVVGPFHDGQSFVLAKIEDKRSYPDSVTVRHILVKTAEQGKPTMDDAAAKSRLDSAVAMLRAGAPFDTVAIRYSDDYNPQATGPVGEYTFQLMQKSQLSKEFGDFSFEGQAGTNKIVKVDNEAYAGYHYIEILKQAAPTPVVKVAFVSKELNVSDETNNALYGKATQFTTKANNAAAFDKLAKTEGITPMPADGLNANSFVVNGLGASRELVKWAYDAKVGDVSPIFTINEKYVVAKLKSEMPAGLAPINEQTRPILEGYVKKHKKAKMLIERSKGKGTLEAIAASETQAVGTADSVNFLQGFIPGVGNEPKVTGYAFYKNFKEQTVSPAIAGMDGVYYISVTARGSKPAEERNLPVERQMLDYSIKSNAANMVLTGLKEVSEVEDKRGKIY
jgi:peptidyl-prolyl cis-trans isomerase D